MSLNKDFEDLLHFLNSEKAEYLIVGAYAVIFYAEPRFTKDLDIWIRPEKENAHKVIEALKKFGAPIKKLTIDDLTNPKMVYQMGIEPNRIDILMGVEKLKFDRAWKNKVGHKYGKEPVYILSLNDLMINKKAVGRLKDQLDLENLKKVKQKKSAKK